MEEFTASFHWSPLLPLIASNYAPNLRHCSYPVLDGQNASWNILYKMAESGEYG